MSDGIVKGKLHTALHAANRAACFMAMASACAEIAPADAAEYMSSARHCLDEADRFLTAAVDAKARMAR